MPEYIERDKILKRFYGAVNFIQDHCTPGLEKAICMLYEEPPADVEPVRHGRWEFIGPYAYNGDGLIGGCSVCKKRIRFFEVPNCCPHCGAKMDLEEGTA